MNGRTHMIEQLITGYIAAHPYAADTVEGIRAWWIAAEMRDASRAEVQHAVDRMIARGALSQTALPEGALLYARAAPPDDVQAQ